MSKTQFGKLFMNGRSQAIRLPKELRFPGDRVRLRRVGDGVLVEPVITDPDELFARLDACGPPDFMAEGRNQPPLPPGPDFDDE